MVKEAFAGMSFTKVRIFLSSTVTESVDISQGIKTDNDTILEQSAQLTEEEELFRLSYQTDCGVNESKEQLEEFEGGRGVSEERVGRCTASFCRIH